MYPILGVKEAKLVLQLIVGVVGTQEGRICLFGLQLGKHFLPDYSMSTAGEKGGAGVPC